MVQLRNVFLDGKLKLYLSARLDNYSDFGSQLTPRLGVIYNLDKKEVVKFLYGNAFRAPVASELTSSGVIQGNPDLEPENIDTYELIWKRNNYNTAYSATLFYSEWNDAIIIADRDDLPAPFIQRYENLGELNSRGVELEFNAIFNRFRIDSAYSYVKSEDRTGGQDYLAFPRHIVQLGITASMNKNLKLRLNNIVYDDVFDSPSDTADRLGTIWMSNFNLTYKLGPNLECALDINDIFNRKDNTPSLWGNSGGLPVADPYASAYLRFKF